MNPETLSIIKEKLVAKAVEAGVLGYVLRDSATNKRLIYCNEAELFALAPTGYKVKGTSLEVSIQEYGLKDLILLDNYVALLLAEQENLKTLQIVDPDLSVYRKTRRLTAVYRDDDVYASLAKFGTVPLVTLSEPNVDLLDLSALFNGAMSKACVYMRDSNFHDGMIVNGRPLIPLVAHANLIKDLIIDSMDITASQQHSADIYADGVDDDSGSHATSDAADETMADNDAFEDNAGDTEDVERASDTLDCLGKPFALDRAGDRAYITAFLQEHDVAKYDVSSDTFDRNGLLRIMTGMSKSNAQKEVVRVKKYQEKNVYSFSIHLMSSCL